MDAELRFAAAGDDTLCIAPPGLDRECGDLPGAYRADFSGVPTLDGCEAEAVACAGVGARASSSSSSSGSRRSYRSCSSFGTALAGEEADESRGASEGARARSDAPHGYGLHDGAATGRTVTPQGKSFQTRPGDAG